MTAAKKSGKQSDLHGNAPDTCDIALLLIDVINDFEFSGGDSLARHARPVAQRLAELKRRAHDAGVPCIYANDNYGRWRSDFSAQVRHCLNRSVRGSFMAEALQPAATDYFVLKPMHSAFYQTCLELLLLHLETRTLVIGGIATDNCVSFTANDAYLRNFELVLLRDGCASIDAKAHRAALAQMERLLHARTVHCGDLNFVRKGKRVAVQT